MNRMNLKEQLKLAEETCKEWMRFGKRKNSNRIAWEHPNDVVKLVDELVHPRNPDCDASLKLKILAWLHDCLEDGIIMDIVRGRKPTIYDLRDLGFDKYIIDGVVWLTRDKNESKRQYLLSLKNAPDMVKTVKYLDRIANLREGKETMTEEWYYKYSTETYMYLHYQMDWEIMNRIEDEMIKLLELGNKK